MKLIKKIIFAVVILMITLILCDNVYATSNAPSSFTVDGTGVWTYTLGNYFKNWQYDGTYHFHHKATSEGKPIYCVEIHNSFGNTTYTLSGEASAPYSYILANGYPNKSITGDDDADYMITSFAIFYLISPSDYIFGGMDFEKGTFYGNSNIYVQEIAKLVNGSKDYSYTEPSIKIDSNNSFSLSSDNKYYVTSSIGVTTTGNVGDYTLKL